MSLVEEPEYTGSFISTIPYPRDPNFVDAGNLIHEVGLTCCTPASKTVVLGESGVGKSSLVIEYTYQVCERFPETSVIWLHAGNEARFEESCSRTISHLNITDDKSLSTSKFIQLCSWLQSVKCGKWILVLDGADDIQLFNNPCFLGPSPAMNHLRHCVNGAIIVTTTSKEVASSFAEPESLVHVDPAQTSHCDLWNLLDRKVNRKLDAREMVSVMNIAGSLPLSIIHTAAYLNYRGSAYTVERYVDDACAYDICALHIKTQNLEDDLESQTSTPTFMPWQLSFDYVFRMRPSAADIVCLASFFDKQGIPEYILRSQPHVEEVENPFETDIASDTSSFTIVDGFEDDLQMLKDLSLITTDTTGNTLEICSLVQFATQRWLKRNGQFDKWQNTFLTRISTEFPSPQPKNWEECHILFPHVQAALKQCSAESSDPSVEEWRKLSQNAILFIFQTGGLSAAQKIEQLSKDMEKATCHRWDLSLSLINMKNWMGELCASMGCWQEAELLSTEGVVQIREVLGQEHTETLRRETNLMTLYMKQGRYQDAEEGYRKLSEISDRVLGSENPETLAHLSNLSTTLEMQERWREAEKPLEQAVDGSTLVLGEGHPVTLERMKSLVRVYLAQGRSRESEAETLQSHLVDVLRAVFGAEHPSTLESMNGLIDMHMRSERWEEAEALQLHVLEAQKKTLGETHPTTLASMENLVVLCLEQEQLQDAEFVQHSIVHLAQEKLGVDHFLTRRAIHKVEDIRKKIETSNIPTNWDAEPERWT